jgi:hypothetical protein
MISHQRLLILSIISRRRVFTWSASSTDRILADLSKNPTSVLQILQKVLKRCCYNTSLHTGQTPNEKLRYREPPA